MKKFFEGPLKMILRERIGPETIARATERQGAARTIAQSRRLVKGSTKVMATQPSTWRRGGRMATRSQAAVQRRKPSRKVIRGMVRTRARPESQMIVVMFKGSQRTSRS